MTLEPIGDIIDRLIESLPEEWRTAMNKGKYIEGGWDTVKTGDKVHLTHENTEMVADFTVHSVNSLVMISATGQLYYGTIWKVNSIWREVPVIELPTLPGLYEMGGFPISTGCLFYQLTDSGVWKLEDMVVADEAMKALVEKHGELERWDSITKVARDITETFEDWSNSIAEEDDFDAVLAHIKDDYGVTE